MKQKIKAVLAIALAISFVFALAACGKGVNITTGMKGKVREAIRIAESYQRGSYTEDVARLMFNEVQKDADELAERYHNEDNYVDMLGASTDILLLSTYLFMGTDSEIEKRIKDMEDKYLGD